MAITIDAVQLALKADALKALRDRRLELSHEVDRLKEEEKLLKNNIIDLMEKSGGTMTGILGAHCRVKLVPKVDVRVMDWDAVWDYIYEHRASEMVQRRIGVTAVRDRWDMGDEVPGVERYEYNDLSITKP